VEYDTSFGRQIYLIFTMIVLIGLPMDVILYVGVTARNITTYKLHAIPSIFQAIVATTLIPSATTGTI
jgi:hypothetical protein